MRPLRRMRDLIFIGLGISKGRLNRLEMPKNRVSSVLFWGCFFKFKVERFKLRTVDTRRSPLSQLAVPQGERGAKAMMF